MLKNHNTNLIAQPNLLAAKKPIKPNINQIFIQEPPRNNTNTHKKENPRLILQIGTKQN